MFADYTEICQYIASMKTQLFYKMILTAEKFVSQLLLNFYLHICNSMLITKSMTCNPDIAEYYSESLCSNTGSTPIICFTGEK